ncbi:pectinesterase family protein [Marinicrinis lubricantis]|uniref:Pectinesterase family protein n=1 Tax=Marinicrinis lubricantis TaxID=2086470 RepID=A0ABW1IVF2_9BACL
MKKWSVLVLAAVLIVSTCLGVVGPSSSFAEDVSPVTPAFPGAEGGGMYTTGGRGGEVYEVTTLADSGPGSLRDAVSGSNRTIVFKVGGVIELQSPLKITGSNLTIAGQTAPGDGITVVGYPTSIDADNLIIRYMRFRLGDQNIVEADAFGGRYHKDIIIDHSSFSWSVDEVMSIYGNENVTVQWSIISEAMHLSKHVKGKHGYGGIWGGKNTSFHHNLIAHNSSRNPAFDSTAGNRHDFRNNVIYNWGYFSAYGGKEAETNLIGNYYKPGPETEAIRFMNAETGGSYYIDGNVMEGYPSLTDNNWSSVHTYPDYVKLSSPVAFEHEITTESADAAYAAVLESAGAVLPKRDAIDARIINDVRNGTGIHINSQDEVGGYPVNEPVMSTIADDDHDGMPNDWELAQGLNPNDPEDRNLTNAEGYTQLELYLNSIVGSGSQNPNVAITAPAHNTIVEAGTEVTIEAAASDSDGTVSKVEFYANGQKLGEDDAAPFQLAWGDIPDGTHFIVVKAVDDSGTQTQSNSVVLHANTTGDISPWTSGDIGIVRIPGHTQLGDSSEEVTVKSAGNIGGRSDQFHFAYQALTGNGEVTARIDHVTGTDGEAEAGVMVRDSLEPDSAMAAFMVSYKKNGQKSVFIKRTSSGTNAAEVEPEEFAQTPVWLKLVRSGDELTALTSKDGSAWKVMHREQIAMGETVYFGLAADASKANDQIERYNTSYFSAASVKSFAHGAPLTPSGVSADPGDRQITLTWDRVDTADSYHVKRSVIPGGPYETAAAEVAGTSYTDTNLTAHQTYYYVVAAVNEQGESLPSAEVSAVPTGKQQTIVLVDDTFEDAALDELPTGYESVLEDGNHKVAATAVPESSAGNDSERALIVYDTAPGNTQSIRKFAPQFGSFVVEADVMAERWPGTSAVLQLKDAGGSKRALSIELQKPTLPSPDSNYTLVVRDSYGSTKLIDPPPVNEWLNIKVVANVTLSTADIYINQVLAADDVPMQTDMSTHGIGQIFASMPGTGSGTMWYDNIKVYVEPVESPKGLIATPGNGKVKLDWNAAAGADAYNVYRAMEDGGPYTAVAEDITELTFIDDTVWNETTYYYVVTAVGPTGESGYSNQAAATPSESAIRPQAPSGVQVKARNSQAELSWDGVEEASSYTVKRSLSPEGPFETVKSGITEASYRDGGLENGVTYYYVVSGTSIAGEGDRSEIVSVTPYGTIGTPVLKAEGANRSIHLQWQTVPNATGYNVKKAITPEGPYATVAEGIAGLEYTDTQVENGIPYYYRVTAANGVTYSLDSNIAAARPRVKDGTPAPPQLVSLLPGDQSMELTWEASNHADGYKVKRSESVSGPYSVIADTKATAYTDQGLTNGKTYYYVVTAYNKRGDSGSSLVMQDTPATVYTVAKDGSGMFTSVQAAIDAVPEQQEAQTIIKISAGEYREHIVIPSAKPGIRLIGEDRDETVLVYHLTANMTGPDGQPLGGMKSASVAVSADRFIAENLTIANDAGDNVGQAIALYTRGDRIELRRVNLLSWQDTFYVSGGNQYVVDSYIEGDVDFIYGGAAVYIENSVIHSLSGGWVTASSAEKDMPGYVFVNSTLTAEPGLKGKVELGRPWRPYANVTFINSYLGDHIAANGWHNWGNPANEATARYNEFHSYGPGANASGRYNWSKQLTVEEAEEYTPESVIGWDPVQKPFLLENVKPKLQLKADKKMLTPPNHKMVPVRITATAEDSGSGIAKIELISVTSNEPDNGRGDGNTVDDIQGADYGTNDTEILLRAERSGRGKDRIYTITYRATDHAGNETTSSIEVRVPHGRGK